MKGVRMERQPYLKSPKDFVNKKVELAKQRDSYVVLSNTLESRAYMAKMIEYDRLLMWIRKRIGYTNFEMDTQEALKLIERCNQHSKEFTNLLNDLRNFVNKYTGGTKNREPQKAAPSETQSTEVSHAGNSGGNSGGNGDSPIENTDNGNAVAAEVKKSRRTRKTEEVISDPMDDPEEVII